MDGPEVEKSEEIADLRRGRFNNKPALIPKRWEETVDAIGQRSRGTAAAPPDSCAELRSDDGAAVAIQCDRGCMAALSASMVDVVGGHAHRADRQCRSSAAPSSRYSARVGRGVGAVSGSLRARTRGPCTTSATVVVGGFFLGGMIRMASHQVLGRTPRIEDLFSVVDVGFNLLAGAVFYGAATFLASLLCVIPGIHRLRAVDVHDSPDRDRAEAGHRCRRRELCGLAPQWLTATIFHLVLSLVSGMGFLFCCAGILFTGPLYSLSVAILFHEFYEPAASAYAKKPPPVDSFRDF